MATLPNLRELRLAHCTEIDDLAFLELPKQLSMDSLRILDLTACENIRDDAVERIVSSAPRLRNLVLAKCRFITDRAVWAICKLGKNLHYVHLGHCSNITDAAVIQLVKSCNRIRYIDLACCVRLTDQSVQELATLPKLRRIGLVKCTLITDRSISALARPKASSHSSISSLERVHLSYCVNLTMPVSRPIGQCSLPRIDCLTCDTGNPRSTQQLSSTHPPQSDRSAGIPAGRAHQILSRGTSGIHASAATSVLCIQW